ncbi:MAG: VWA domain-containing protein [Bdellovibrionales bacterium]|nr:VWA domain-containing protein [Bdellovibrionales bacterium]
MDSLGITFSHGENSILFFVCAAIVLLMIKTVGVRRRAAKVLGLDKEFYDFEAPINRWLKNFLFILGISATALAAMGPQWGQQNHPIKAQGLDICFALDLSRSMMAEDQAPSRLAQAKSQLEIYLQRLGGDRAALVGFGGGSYIAAPLSVDHAALATFLQPMTPDSVSDQATNLSSGVDSCLTALGLDKIKDRNELLDEVAKLVVLISDGEDTAPDDTGAIKRAERLGVPVFAMAVGTAKGAPIPIRDRGQLTGYLKDPSTNQPVLTKLEVKGLKDITSQTGGEVFYASDGVEAWKSFEKAISEYKRASRDAGTKLDKEERFQWPLLLAFIALLWDFLLTETRWRWSLRILPWLLILPLTGLVRESRAAEVVPPLPTPSHLGAIHANNLAIDSANGKDFKKADGELLQALGEDASNPWLQYNWSANKLQGAVDPEDPQKSDKKAAEEAASTLEKMRSELKPGQGGEEFQSKLAYQLGQAYELKGDNAKALENYYRVLPNSPDAPRSEALKALDQKAKANIARLLFAESSGGGGGGGGQGDKKDNKEGDSKDSKGNKDGKSEISQAKSKPKFSGTDLNESQANQIIESVSSAEREVLQSKSQQESRENAVKRNRDAREKGQAGRNGKQW